MTEDSLRLQVARKCVLVTNVPVDNTDTVLSTLFPTAVRWVTDNQTGTAIVLFHTPSGE